MKTTRTMLVTSVLMLVAATVAQGEIVTFQEGANGYNSGTDTYIMNHVNYWNNNVGARDYLYCYGYYGSAPKKSLVKFDNIFGSGPGQIPTSVTVDDIVGAYLGLTPVWKSGAEWVNVFPF